LSKTIALSEVLEKKVKSFTKYMEYRAFFFNLRAVKCRIVLLNRELIFIIGWFSGITVCMLFTFKNKIPTMRYLEGGGQWCGIFHCH